MPHGHANLGETTPRSVFYAQGRFGRLLPTLPPFAADTPTIRAALAELGGPGGPMDPGDDLSDPVILVTDPAKSAANPDNPIITAGFTFLGQFLDHDLTVDGGQTALLAEEIPGSAAVSIDGSTRLDVPRNGQLVALLGDPRNDENLVVSQLQ